MGAALRVYLFGEPRLEYAGVVYPFAAPPKTLPLLAYLLLHRHAPATRSTIAAALWAESDHVEALANLRRHLHYLNKALPQPRTGGPWVLADLRTVCWNAAAPYWLDVEIFETESQEMQYRAHAARLYSADLYECCADEWIFFDRERLRSLQMTNLALLSEEARERRAYLQALQYARLMLALDPWREDALRSVVEIRALLGDRAGASAEYERFAQRLKDELGVSPSDESANLFARLRHHAQTAIQPPNKRGEDAHPLIGRRNEIAMLAEEWHRAAQGRCRLLLIGGEAGVGKTALLTTLEAIARAEGAPILRGVSGTDSPYQAFIEILRQLDADAVARVEAAGAQDRLHFFDAIAKTLEGSARNPVLVLLEDLHECGAAALDLLRYLVTRLAHVPILFAATYREYEVDRTHPLRAMRRQLSRTGSLAHLAVTPLDRESARELARSRASRPIEDDIADRMYEATDGNPLFMIEVLHQYAHGDLDGIPPSVATIVRMRLEALDPTARTVAETAAIAGQHCRVEQIAQITGLREGETLAAFDDLVTRHVVRESWEGESGDFTFVHEIVRQAVYEQIPHDALRRRHARFGLALRAFHSKDAAHAARAVARHLELGGLSEEAAQAYATAAEAALQLYAHDEARHCALKVRELSNSPELHGRALLVSDSVARSQGARDEQRSALESLMLLAPKLPENVQIEELCRRCEFFVAVSDERAEQALAELHQRCPQHPHLRARALLASGEFAQRRGRYEDAAAQLREARRLFRERGNMQGEFESYSSLLDTMVSAGTLKPRVVREIDDARMDAAADPRASALLAFARGRALYNYDPTAGYAAGEEMLRSALLANDRWLEALAHRTMGACAGHLNRFSLGESHLRQSEDLINASGRILDFVRVRYIRMSLTNRAGYVRGSVDLAEDALPAARTCGSADLQVRIELILAEADMLAGDLDRAIVRAQGAMEKAERFGLGGIRPAIGYLLGTLQVALESPRRGIGTLLEAERTAAQFGISLSHSPPVLGLAYLCDGDVAAAAARADELRERMMEVSSGFFFPQGYLWAAAQLFHFLDRDADALAFAQASHLRYTQMLDSLNEGPMRAAFLDYRINRAIVGLHERGTWAPDPLQTWFRA